MDKAGDRPARHDWNPAAHILWSSLVADQSRAFWKHSELGIRVRMALFWLLRDLLVVEARPRGQPWKPQPGMVHYKEQKAWQH